MDLDTDIRLTLYERFVDEGEPPTAAEVAEALAIPVEEAEDGFRRLEAAHVIVLAPGTLNVWMANPLSAVPTAFRVRTERGDFWGNCIWDGLGVVSMLGRSGTLETSCPDCLEPLRFEIDDGQLVEAGGIAHFVVPAARWWENIGFT
jgi:hypothetical protein